MKVFRRILSGIICTIFLASLCGCHNEPEPPVDEPADDNIRVMPIEEPKPEWEYYENSFDGISIKAYNGNDVVAEIPAELDGKPVTRLGYFFEIENEVTTTLKFPAGIEDIPSGEIGKNLTEFIVDAGNERYFSQNGCIFYKSYHGNDVLAKCPQGRLGEFVVPSDVEGIAGGAFNGCSKITAVKLPESVDYIGSFAFNDCAALASINLPETVTWIDAYSFQDCTSLETLEIPEGVSNIGAHAFDGTPFLKKLIEKDPLVVINGILVDGTALKGEVVIPDTVTKIVDEAFTSSLMDENTTLKKVTLPEGLTKVDYHAFADCTALETVILPESLKYIEMSAFKNCKSLKCIELPSGLKSIGMDAFRGCTSLTEVDIPDGVTDIDMEAFKGCENLERVSVPDSVIRTSLNDCFEDCEKINVTFKGKTYTAANIDEFYAAVEENAKGDSQ